MTSFLKELANEMSVTAVAEVPGAAPAPAKMAVEHLNLFYGDFQGLRDVNLTFPENQVTALIGPSGCGKSTLLKTLNRMNDLIPDTRLTGEIRIDGQDIYGKGVQVDELRKNVGMVFQRPNPFPKSIFENVAYGLRVNGITDNAFIRQRVEETLKGAALWDEVKDKLKVSAYALSGGQQQRLCIARAMAVSPSVLLMDEPLSNLDAKLRNQMRAELIKLRQRINTTFIYVTHDQTEAMTLGDRIVIMKDGVIQQIGTPQEVFNHPANLFVAGFIGMPQMNFYDAELVLEDGQYAVVLDGAKVTLPEEKQAKLKANGAAAGPITLGVRPEHLILSGDEGSMIHGTVDVSEMMGSAVHLHVSACGSDTIMIVPTTELESTSAFTIGSPIAFTFNGVMAHLFDRNTQKNLEV